MLRTLLIALLSIGIIDCSLAQQIDSWDRDWDKVLSDESDEKEIFSESLYEELSELSENPLNINVITKEQLEKFPFLSSLQIESLLTYLYINGPMKTLNELLLVENFDYDTQKLFRHFVYIGEEKTNESVFSSLRNIAKYGKHEVITRIDVPLYKKNGYQHYSDDVLQRYPNRQYLGDPYYHSLRYSFKYSDRLYAGFVFEKDAGEPFFSKNTRSYDYTSFYILLKNVGGFKSLALGNYRLRFGQGLVMNTDFSLGKNSLLSSINWGGRGIKKHSSASESNAFQGLAATYQLWKFDLTAFFSYRQLDSNLDEKLFITSLKTDGLHRTPLEYSKRKNTDNALYGSNISFYSGGFHLGLTAVYTTFNRVLKPGEQHYKYYDPHGYKFFTSGFDYMYQSRKFIFSGETAISKNGALATLNSIQYRPWEQYKFVLLQRYYAHNYHSLYGNSFSENSVLRNESGIYFGLEASPFSRWRFSGYIDFCYFPWLKYGVSAASHSGETSVQAIYEKEKRFKILFRYRCKIKERDYKDYKGKYLASHVLHRFRFQQDYSPSEWITLSTLLDYNCSQFMNSFGKGYMFTERLSWKPNKLPISLNINFSYFNTDSYENRISVYEHGLLHTFSVPSFYYHGIHGSTVFRWDMNKLLTTLVKISYTNYFNRSSIGTGTEQINASHREDISVQVRLKI